MVLSSILENLASSFRPKLTKYYFKVETIVIAFANIYYVARVYKKFTRRSDW